MQSFVGVQHTDNFDNLVNYHFKTLRPSGNYMCHLHKRTVTMHVVFMFL
jgi:hypothetical protein